MNARTLFLVFLLALACAAILPSCESKNHDGDDDSDNNGPAGMRWIDVPAGTFFMGCSPDDADCQADESPLHAIDLSAFQINETEVTQAQYVEVIGVDPAHFNDCVDCPVEQVSWNDALAFCLAVGGRLPTEAEWEFAARGRTSTRAYCGDDPACLDDIAWTASNSDSRTQPVAQLEPNEYGLYDMIGNVWEWVNDWYDASYYQYSPTSDPAGPAVGADRGMRGAAWNNAPDTTRVSYRNHDLPKDRSMVQGFRCARDD